MILLLCAIRLCVLVAVRNFHHRSLRNRMSASRHQGGWGDCEEREWTSGTGGCAMAEKGTVFVRRYSGQDREGMLVT